MRAVDIIARKRDGEELTTEEIDWFIQAYTHGDVPDYQAAAWLMATYLQGMSHRETVDLTLAMAHSGEILDLSEIAEYTVDKHSSGGVGDKTSLIVLPLVAACGIPVAKMSGHSLGFSGGTLDKMESISGYRSELSHDEFMAQAKEHGVVLCGQTANLAPADGLLYALRDVTATVSSLPLIASSIMSKKIAAGANGIVLDVKVGLGAFMKHVDAAKELAHLMVKIGHDVGREMVALISDMNQPLGHAVGNALEVREALDALRGGGPPDLREHSLIVAAHMLRLARRDLSDRALASAMAELVGKLDNGEALAKFRDLVVAQGGNVRMVDNPDLLPQAALVQDVLVPQGGYVAQLSALEVARAALALGAGREKKSDQIDHAVGVLSHLKVGDQVHIGDKAFTIHANSQDRLEATKTHLARAIVYRERPQPPLPLFYDTIASSAVSSAM